MPNDKREEFLAEIATMKAARRRSKSHHLKSDYGKAVRRMQNELRTYDMYQRKARHDQHGETDQEQRG